MSRVNAGSREENLLPEEKRSKSQTDGERRVRVLIYDYRRKLEENSAAYVTLLSMVKYKW